MRCFEKVWNFSAPWNQNEFFPGWILSTFYTMFAAGGFVYVNSTMLTLFIGVNLHFKAFSCHFNEIINEASKDPQQKNSNIRTLSSAINFHNEMKE